MTRYVRGDPAVSPLRIDIGIPTLWSLPPHSIGPRGDTLGAEAHQIAAIAAAGYEGIQLYTMQNTGPLRRTAIGIALQAADIPAIARQHRDAGCDATTLVLGNGLEDDRAIDALLATVTAVADDLDYPLFVETHRGTITQDIRRTLDALDRHPALMLNADLSHWYTGLEMRFGDYDARVAALDPVFARVGFIHGRIGDSGAMQRPLSAPGMERSIADMTALWQRCFAAFCARATPGDRLIFSPQLLPPRFPAGPHERWLGYGEIGSQSVERGDRWTDALALAKLAQTAFAQNLADLGRARDRPEQR